ncbi:pig-Q [Microbotryomycetes sp. JL201]|nr:pig-Q [Microbotryomycetes sp. JL201]
MSLSPSPSPQPRPWLPRLNSSSSRRSSAIYQLPLDPPAPPTVHPPAPEPEHYVFFPTSVPCCREPAASDAHMYLFGWRGLHATVIAGSIYASSRQDAMTRLNDKLKGSLRGLTIVGRIITKGKQVDTSDASEDNLLTFETSSPHSTTLLAASERAAMVTYTPPNRTQLQFFSLSPLQLDLNSFVSPLRRRRLSKRARAKLKREDTDKAEALALSDKLRRLSELDFTSAMSSEPIGVADLHQVIDWLNLAPHLTAKVIPPTSSYRPTFGVPRVLKKVVRPVLHTAGGLARFLIRIATWELPVMGGTALKDLSATIQQVDTRLSQGLSWPSQFSLIRQTVNASAESTDMPTLTLGCAHYIQFYNTMWLIANDVIVGSAFTSFVCENSEYLGRLLAGLVQRLTLSSLRDILLWLNDWPGGVKLNFELASLFCDWFLWGTGLWEEYALKRILPHLPSIVYIVGLSGLLGTTMFISVASDLLAVLTLHLFVFYLMATFIFRWHVSMLGALFNIFRGKKYNVLRKRVEPAVYEVDQLLLGTILFTLATFLFPTVLVYYLAFAASRLGIVLLHAALETILAFMNHFPLFAVMLRFKDPARLPGGVQFVPRVKDERLVLDMTNNPVHLAGIFFQHLQLSRRLASHYSPIYLLGRLFSDKTMRFETLVALAVAAASPVMATRTIAKRRYVPDVPVIDDEAGLFERYVAAQLRTYKDHLPRRRTAKLLRPPRNTRNTAFSDTFGSPSVVPTFEGSSRSRLNDHDDDDVEPVYSHLTGLESLLAQRRKLTDSNGQPVNKRQAKLAYRQSLLGRLERRSLTTEPVKERNDKKRTFGDAAASGELQKRSTVFEGSAKAIEKRVLVDHTPKEQKRRLHKRYPKDDLMEWSAARQAHLESASQQLVLEEGDMDGDGDNWNDIHVIDERDSAMLQAFDERAPPLKMEVKVKKESPLM